MRRIPTRLFFAVVFGVSTLALAAPAPASSPALLPNTFAGWTATGPLATTPPAAEAAVLHEYGLAQYAAAVYSAGSHRLDVRAMRFADATGAYGTFTLERQPNMHFEKLGREGASSGGHFVFWTGTTVVDANFGVPAAEENAALSALAAGLPTAAGTESVPPTLPHYLPTTGLDATSVRYAIGPIGYAGAGGTLPAGAIDFGLDTEAVIARYGPPGAPETLTLLLYPTPQIAAAHLKSIEALAKSPGTVTARSGPLLAIASGSASAVKATQLVKAVHFNDAVTINHPEGYVPETVKVYRLLFGITMLVTVLVCAALLLGLFLGGGRALIRVLRGKPVSSVSEEEFISLHLS
jgi:hypothetical protein